MEARDSSRLASCLTPGMTVPPGGVWTKREPQFLFAGSSRSNLPAASKVIYLVPDKTLLDVKFPPAHV